MRRVADVSSVSGVSFDFCAVLVFSLWFLHIFGNIGNTGEKQKELTPIRNIKI